MRVPLNPQPGLSCTPVLEVELNTGCRDEIIRFCGRCNIFTANQSCGSRFWGWWVRTLIASRKLGRQRMEYWQIVVLAAVRLGCNLNYDKLQDLAEQHRALRQIMGIGDWDEHVHFDWRRIRDNIDWLRPQTLRKINELVVAAGHRLVPKAAESVRGDSFVVETNIHYPTDSSLIADGLRKILQLGAALAVLLSVRGWRQYQHLLKKVRTRAGEVSKAARSKGGHKAERVQAAYKPLFHLADELIRRAKLLELKAVRSVDLETIALQQELKHFRELTEKVCGYSKRRVLHGEVIANSEKIFSLFEPHTELIRRGKVPEENQFGHSALIIEDAAGFIRDYQVMPNGAQDRAVVVPRMRSLQERLRGKIHQASFDRAFHSSANQMELAKIVALPCVPMAGAKGEEATIDFRRARENHPGVESAINALQAGNGLSRNAPLTA